jgi:hypothetical protein
VARSRKILVLVLASVVVWAGSCSSDSEEAPNPGGGGSGGTNADASPEASTGFASTSCGTCVFDTCADMVAACDAQATCAEYLGCLKNCSVDANGYAEASCVTACPRPTEGVAKDAAAKLDACREFAIVDECPSCGSNDADADNPILNQNCPASSETDTCAKCNAERCCETYDTCAKDPGCVDISVCASQCEIATYATCLKACFDQEDADAVAKYTQDFACFDALCSYGPSCPWEPPGPCNDCFLENCTQVMLACDTDPDCMLIEVCVSNCGPNADCILDCQAGKSPETLAKFEARLLCKDLKCASVCG